MDTYDMHKRWVDIFTKLIISDKYWQINHWIQVMDNEMPEI